MGLKVSISRALLPAVLGSGIVLEFVVFIELVVFPNQLNNRASFSASEAQVLSALSPLCPVLLLGLLYTWVLKLCAWEASRQSSRISHIINVLARSFAPLVAWIPSANLHNAPDGFHMLDRPRLILGMAIISSILVAYTPYRPDINPTGNLVGTDAPLYVDWIDQMLSKPISQALQYAFVSGGQGTRPLLLILLYSFASIAHVNAVQIVRALPPVLAPLLVVSSYVFVCSGLEDEKLAGLVAILTSFSFDVTVGIWAGYFANWLALVESYFFLALLLKFAKSSSAFKTVAMTILSISILLTHPWTWGITISIMAMFVVTGRDELRTKFATRSIVIIFVAGIAADIAKTWFFGSQTLGGDLASRTASYGIVEFLSTWQNIIDALLVRYDGLFGHSLLLGLAFLSVSALKFGSRFERLLIVWVALSSLPFTFLDGYHQTRIIYDLPIPTLASVGLFFVLQRFRQRSSWSWGILFATVLFNANYALSAMLRV